MRDRDREREKGRKRRTEKRRERQRESKRGSLKIGKAGCFRNASRVKVGKQSSFSRRRFVQFLVVVVEAEKLRRKHSVSTAHRQAKNTRSEPKLRTESSEDDRLPKTVCHP